MPYDRDRQRNDFLNAPIRSGWRPLERVEADLQVGHGSAQAGLKAGLYIETKTAVGVPCVP